ncbi:hypothetical protein HOY80DRAFT_1019384 [Tuber brumale]|nr:hypothetical protein HOY80DRAFT_1019384 [Tuber brumale]
MFRAFSQVATAFSFLRSPVSLNHWYNVSGPGIQFPVNLWEFGTICMYCTGTRVVLDSGRPFKQGDATKMATKFGITRKARPPRAVFPHLPIGHFVRVFLANQRMTLPHSLHRPSKIISTTRVQYSTVHTGENCDEPPSSYSQICKRPGSGAIEVKGQLAFLIETVVLKLWLGYSHIRKREAFWHFGVKLLALSDQPKNALALNSEVGVSVGGHIANNMLSHLWFLLTLPFLQIIISCHGYGVILGLELQ